MPNLNLPDFLRELALLALDGTSLGRRESRGLRAAANELERLEAENVELRRESLVRRMIG